MNLAYATYAMLTAGICVSAFPPALIYAGLGGRHGRGLRERLGFVPREALQGLAGSPRIWIHAVSLGEVKVAEAVIGALRDLLPDCSVMVSTVTEHGRDLARETFRGRVPVVYAPLDTVFSVRRALGRARPRVVAFLETEIWPAWLAEARRMGIRTALINGRISVRSFPGYLRLRPFFRAFLRHVDAFSMIGEEDARRVGVLGADRRRIAINGNAKYDFPTARTDPAVAQEMRALLNLGPSQQVFVAGSTRQGEEPLILEAYAKILKHHPDTVLVIAPRHIGRTPQIEALLRARGFPYRLRDEIRAGGAVRTEPVVVMNTFGELFDLYSVGTIVFCGASLVPLGGQNPLEPAAWGKAVFYGPSMEDFMDAKTLLEGVGAAMEVSGPDMLAERALWFMARPQELEARGARARAALERNRGSAGRHAAVIAGLAGRQDR